LEIKARRRKEACVGRIVREENVFTRAGPSYRMQMMSFSLTSHDRKKREKKRKRKERLYLSPSTSSLQSPFDEKIFY